MTLVPTRSPWKNPFLYSGAISVVVALYVLFIFLSRFESRRQIERRNAEKLAEQQRENDKKVVEQLGGSALAIRSLYLSPPAIRRGETSQLCYDVSNASTVTLDPPEADVWPSHSRCVDLSPRKTTAYTLSITGANGQTASQSITLEVR